MRKVWRLTACGLVLTALVLAVVLYYTLRSSEPAGPAEDDRRWLYPEPRRAKGAIASNGGPCAPIGMKILEKYGNAVDALIATMLCDGVTVLQNMGIGGGFIGTLYIKSLGKVVTINARESAPAGATADMFVGNSSLSIVGGLSVGVPGELRGYWSMYEKYGGSAPWAELFQDTIDLCENGVPVNLHLDKNIKSKAEFIRNTPGLRKILVKENGELLVLGDTFKLLKLAETLRVIAKEGPNAIYNGSLTAGLVKDIRDHGGIITAEDLANYQVRWEEPVTTKLSSGLTVHSTPLIGSGPILHYILKLLDGELPADEDDPQTTFMVSEAFKFAYGMRSMLGDPYFVNDTSVLDQMNNATYIKMIKEKLKVANTSNDVNYYGSHYLQEDHGTANIVVYGPNGDAISATSTVNTRFGSGIVSESTGIILNNEMDDFSTPGVINFFGVSPSSENFIAPNKRPMSSMVPTIIVDQKGDPKLLVGGAGGTKITSATALTIIRNIFYNQTITKSIDDPRYHHQLMPMTWYYEPLMDKSTVESMKARGHQTAQTQADTSCITAISIDGDILGASSDVRRGGNTSYLLF